MYRYSTRGVGAAPSGAAPATAGPVTASASAAASAGRSPPVSARAIVVVAFLHRLRLAAIAAGEVGLPDGELFGGLVRLAQAGPDAFVGVVVGLPVGDAVL